MIKDYARFFYSRSDSNSSEAHCYLFGLLQGHCGAKNIERMEERIDGFEYQSVHHFISTAPWEHRPLMDALARHADGLLGGSPRTRLVLDDTGIQKKGNSSVGVARQYLGRLGKVDNGQVAVCASLAAGQRSTLVDIRLYLPQSWCEDCERCKKAGVPESERTYRSKTAIAREIIAHQRAIGVRFDLVNMDSGYGHDQQFLHELDGDGEIFVAEVHSNQRVWEEKPWMHREGSRPGKNLAQVRPSCDAVEAKEWAAGQHDTQWHRLKVRDSNQGWVEVSWMAQRVWVADGEREKCWWLLTWENPDEITNNGGKLKQPRRHFALSNAAADEDPRVLVSDAVGRNVVERNFRDAKSEVGMADYQTRGWRGWNHHMALVMMAMVFLLQEKMHNPGVETAEGTIDLTAGDITFMLEHLIPRRLGGAPEISKVCGLLEKRIQKRLTDQIRRRRKTRAQRPPIWANEDISQITE